METQMTDFPVKRFLSPSPLTFYGANLQPILMPQDLDSADHEITNMGQTSQYAKVVITMQLDDMALDR